MERQEALQASLAFERVMKTKRMAAINKSLNSLKDVPPSRWSGELQFSEPYLNKLLESLYISIGLPVAVSTGNRLLPRKSSEEDLYAGAIKNWTKNHFGEKIKAISGTITEWMVDTMRQLYEDNPDIGVEALTQIVRKQYRDVATWQIRRIMQTETMTSLGVAGSVAANALGIGYEKTWSIAGINTRPTHQVMDGVTVGQYEPFMVGGYPMDYPMDDSQGAPAEEIINCSCTCIYLPSGNGAEEI